MPDPIIIDHTTPYIIYLTLDQLNDIKSIASGPSLLSGGEFKTRALLLETLQQAVTVQEYNSAIITKVILAQKKLADDTQSKVKTELELAQEKALTPVTVPAPEDTKKIIANTSDTFRPRVTATVKEKEAIPKKPAKKAATKVSW